MYLVGIGVWTHHNTQLLNELHATIHQILCSVEGYHSKSQTTHSYIINNINREEF